MTAPDVENADPTRPAVSKPPFQDLVKPGTEPAGVPHFGPIDPPDEDAGRRPTLAERWRALPARRQKQAVGAAVAVMACGVFFWPNTSEALPPRTEPRPEQPPAVVVPGPPGPTTVVQITPVYYQLTATRIPVNTRVTAENVTTLFKKLPANDVPPDSVTVSDRIVGKYVVAELNAGQFVARAALADQPLPPPAEPVVAPAPRPVGPTERRVVRVLTGTGTRVSHYEFWPDSGWRVGSEEFLPRAGLQTSAGGQE